MRILNNKLMSIKRIAFFYQFIIIAVIMLVTTTAWIVSEYKHYKFFEQKQGEFILKTNKDILFNEANRICDLIDYSRQVFSNDSIAQEYVLNYLKSYRFQNSGYIFVNNMEGKALLFEGQRFDNKIITGLVDAKGQSLFALEKKACENMQGDFIKYYFQKIGDTIPIPKIAFIKPYSDFNWMIGAGNYLDELHQQTVDFLSFFWNKFIKTVHYLMVYFIIVIIIVYFLSKLIGERFSQLMKNMQLYFDARIRGEDVIFADYSRLIIKELRALYLKLDKAIDRKNVLEEEQKERTAILEQMVKERTKELEIKSQELEDRNNTLSRINDLFVDREYRIKELKDEIAELQNNITKLRNKFE